jgi:hypothetical protein
VSKTIVELTISLDGFATGESVDVEHPFGHSGQQLYAWHQSTDPASGCWTDSRLVGSPSTAQRSPAPLPRST